MRDADVRLDHAGLLRVLREPARLASLEPREFVNVLEAAEQCRLLGWVLSEVDRQQLLSRLPAWVSERVSSLAVVAREYERGIRWEIDRLRRAFSDTDTPWLLLKGAAYVAASLPPGRGRLVADVDVLVPLAQLRDAERALNSHGWRTGDLDPYDERYYREWMHELPPMVHAERRSIVDVHHAILPRTSRLQPDTARLVARARTLDGNVAVLCPSHMVLHAAAHLFHDGEVTGAIRDVVDLDRLLREFGRDAAFWADLAEEARALGLTRPAYYAIRYAVRVMDTPVPADAARATDTWGPPPPVRALMDALVERALPGVGGRASQTATFALYVRAHWLRMPPLLLARHLLHQSVRRRDR